MPDLAPLTPGDDVTQYGRVVHGRLHFRNRPRRGERGVSLIHGRVSRERATQLVCRFRNGVVRPTDAVRYSTVGVLTAAGFRVHRRPTTSFPEHLEVDCGAPWDDGIAERFDECFGGHVSGTPWLVT
ncbi:MAG TPA: hypothetical protein VG318_07985 [Actinomycetota bacterium]|nr:hypothetical protein [Actinomycetota bacterium]